MTQEAMDRLQKARIGLVLGSPFFGMLAQRLNLIVDEKSDAPFWTDGTTLAVRPDAALELEMVELEGMVARGVMHAALCHPQRREGRDVKRWSEACGHVASLEVLSAGMKLPKQFMPDTQHAGKTAEQVYGESTPPEQPPQGGGKGEGEQGEGDGSAQQGAGQPQQQGGDAQAGQQDEQGSGGMEVRDAQGDDADLEQQQADWREAVAQAAQTARVAGQLPGSIERTANEILSPRVSWQEALQRFFKSRAKDDQSWMRPNRRTLHTGVILPGRHSNQLGAIAIAVDLSGSVPQDKVNAFFAELGHIVEECSPEHVYVMPFDSRVRDVLEFDRDEPLTFTAKAGGGTDFRPAVQELAARDVTPDVLVYLTDLECNSFAQEPDYPVIWCVARTKHSATPPYGELVEL